MQNGDRESTQDWLVPEDDADEFSVARTGQAVDERPEGGSGTPDFLAQAQEAAAQATASASRAGASSSAAAACLRRAEQVLALDRDASRAAVEAAVSADRAAATALAVQERYGQDFERLHAGSVHAAAQAQSAAAIAERAGTAALKAQEIVRDGSELAEETMVGLARRVETTLASLEARDRATERRREEAAREGDALRNLTERADRIVGVLRALEER